MRILLVDDDELLTQTLTRVLTAQHYAVDVAMDGEEGWDYTQVAFYDLIVLDVNLPKLDGVRLCQKLRQHKCDSAILLLTAKGDSSDKVMGLDAGADDYLVKPCTTEELSARIRALLRRQMPSTPLLLEWGNICLNPVTCEVTYQAQLLTLSPKEYSLLELFLRSPQRVFSSSSILEHLWGFGDAPGEETIRTHIKRLRRKLKSVGAGDVIETVYGMGYRLKPLSETGDLAIAPPPSPASADSFVNSVNFVDSVSPVSPVGLLNAVPTNAVPTNAVMTGSSPALSAADQAREAAIALWDQFKPPILERMGSLDRAIAALQTGHLSEDLRQQAINDAHKLSGSLGMFGFPNGSRLGHEIEDVFQKVSSSSGLDHLQTLIRALYDELQSPPQSSNENLLTALSEDPPEPQPVALRSPQAADFAMGDRSGRSLQVKVLVLDDDDLILESLRQFLPRWGIDTVTISNPLDLWQTLEQEQPDLLILDVDMPHINGIEVCKVIRNNDIWNGLPILFLTAHRSTETILQIYSAGADDYVAKPFTEPEVITRIFNRLERNRLLRNWQRPCP
ncbi:MAG TPA: response regulator [Chroococcidiopsis sp.]